MARRVAPNTADSEVTMPVSSGPRCESACNIAFTQSRTDSGCRNSETLTMPQMPHIAKILRRGQKNANIKWRQLLDGCAATGGNRFKLVSIFLPGEQKHRMIPRGEPLVQFGDGNEIRRPRMFSLQ